jgi:hypothetical protein
MIQTKEMKQMAKDKQNLIRQIDQEKDKKKLAELKKKLKNLNERIRVHTKKVNDEAAEKVAEDKVPETVKPAKKTRKAPARVSGDTADAIKDILAYLDKKYGDDTLLKKHIGMKAYYHYKDL